MGVFRRLADIISANINDLIDKAEDPEKMAKQIIREMEENIGVVRGQVAAAMAAERQTANTLTAARADAGEWEQRAVRAIELDREELARQALVKKRDAERVVRGSEPQLARGQQAVQVLRDQLRILEDRIMLARRKRDTIIARKRMAEAQTKVNRSMGRFGKVADHLTRLSGMADRVDEMEARTTAAMELLSETAPLEAQFERIEEEHSIESELASLKQRVKKLPAPKPAATEPSDAEKSRRAK